MAPPVQKQKGPSAYMVFAEEQRPNVLIKLRAEAADGKVPVTVVAKALGELWKSMPETEQQSYRDKAQQRAAEANAAAKERGATTEDTQQGAEAGAAVAASVPAALPRHLVKKIMLADDEVRRVSAEAQWLVAEAAAFFLQQLAVKAAAAAAAKKRKTIQLADFEQVVRCDKRLVEAGLKDIVQNKRFFELQGVTNTSKAAGSNSKQHPGKGAAAASAAAQSKPQQAGDHGDKENQQQQDLEGEGGYNGDDRQVEDAAAEELGGEQLTDEQRIEIQEQKRRKAEAMAKARAVKAAERKVAKEREAAKGYHKISTFFASNKPDTFV